MQLMQQVSEEFWRGIEQFNHREFYECHDTLEPVWMIAEPSEKNFYQGILQISVSLYHLSNQNWRGAVILLGEGINRLRNYQPIYGDINVESLVQEANELLRWLQKLGPEQVGDVVQHLRLGSFQSTLAPSAEELPQVPIIQKVVDQARS